MRVVLVANISICILGSIGASRRVMQKRESSSAGRRLEHNILNLFVIEKDVIKMADIIILQIYKLFPVWELATNCYKSLLLMIAYAAIVFCLQKFDILKNNKWYYGLIILAGPWILGFGIYFMMFAFLIVIFLGGFFRTLFSD